MMSFLLVSFSYSHKFTQTVNYYIYNEKEFLMMRTSYAVNVAFNSPLLIHDTGSMLNHNRVI